MLDCTVKEIKAKLNDRIIEVVSSLLPNGKHMGNEWITGDANGSAGKSLKVHLSGDKVGVWCDFATGKSGDIINLWCITRNLSFPDAMNEIRQKLGIATPKMSMSHTTKNYARPRLPQISQALSEESTAIKYLIEERKLTLQTLQKYRITTAADQILFPYYRGNELIMIKYLNVFRGATGKKEMSVSANCEPCLFGWQAVGRGDLRSLVIVEGEIDAMTLTQYDIPHIVLSVPYGGGIGDKQKWIVPEFDNLIIFDEIFLCLDNDKPGQDAMQEIGERLGKHRCRMVKLPYKDANECLQKGISAAEIERCFAEAQSFDPVNLRYWSMFANDSENRFEPPNGIVPGYRLLWPKTASKILFRPNEISTWTGINGHGKSLFVGQVMLGCMKQGAKVCIASMEMPAGYVLHHLVQQTAGLELPTKEYRNEIYRWYNEKGWIFDVAGNANVEQMLGTFEYAIRKYAVDVFMIDSFMLCGIGEDDFTGQKKLMEQLCRFVRQNNCHLHIIVHPRKGADESQIPGKMDMKGTGAISDLASNCFCIWRNKQKEDKLGRMLSKHEVPPQELLEDADCWLRCDKQRSGDWEGRIPFWFDKKSHSYVEKVNQRPVALVEYSNIVKLHG